MVVCGVVGVCCVCVCVVYGGVFCVLVLSHCVCVCGTLVGVSGWRRVSTMSVGVYC